MNIQPLTQICLQWTCCGAELVFECEIWHEKLEGEKESGIEKVRRALLVEAEIRREVMVCAPRKVANKNKHKTQNNRTLH